MRGAITKMARKLKWEDKKLSPAISLPFNLDMFLTPAPLLPPKMASLFFLQGEQSFCSACVTAEINARHMAHLEKQLQIKPRRIPDEIVVREIILNSDRFYRPAKKSIKKITQVKDPPKPKVMVKRESFLWKKEERDENEVFVDKSHSILTKKPSAPKNDLFRGLIQKHLMKKALCDRYVSPVIPLGSPPHGNNMFSSGHLFLLDEFRGLIELCEDFLHFERMACGACSSFFMSPPYSVQCTDLDNLSLSSWSTATDPESSCPTSPITLNKVC